MEHKDIAPRFKPSPPADSTIAAAAANGGASNPDNSPNHAPKSPISDLEGSINAIKAECERALTALRRGDHSKALSLMKDLCLKHENSPHSALIHRVQGTVCVNMASIIDDPDAKQMHLKNAIESAKQADSTAVAAADGGASNPDNSPNHAPKSPILDLEGISNGDNNANPCSPEASVKVECERALTALRSGNHTEALRLMKDLCFKHENSPHSALIHRVQGTVCVKVASIIDDPTAKKWHLKNAVESARKAVSLSPDSIEFSHFYANLLYEAANDGKYYEEVVEECDRGLLIKTPVDPANESLQEDSRQKITTPEARVAHVQNELRSLIQKANIASIASWMKNLNSGEEKFQLIPIRRVPEDPMVQTRRPNEVKRPTKTSEERRREIEIRVAAAKLLQHKSESSPNQDAKLV